jgi:hypothetical protein
MPTRNEQDFVLSDDDVDELESQDEFDEEEVKPGTGPFTGALVKPRHVTVACRQLYGKCPLIRRLSLMWDGRTG